MQPTGEPRSQELENAIIDGMARATSAAEKEDWWWDLHLHVIPEVLRAKGVGSLINAVDFWNALRQRGYSDFDHMSAMGHVMRRLAKDGILSFQRHINPKHTDGHGFHVEWKIERI